MEQNYGLDSGSLVVAATTLGRFVRMVYLRRLRINELRETGSGKPTYRSKTPVWPVHITYHFYKVKA